MHETPTMKKTLFLTALLFSITLLMSCQPQADTNANSETKTAPADSSVFYNHSLSFQDYAAYHRKNSDLTCFESTKLSQLTADTDQSGRAEISEADFKAVTAKEHFIHAFQFPETFHQACYAQFYPKNFSEMIMAYLDQPGDGYLMSQRQKEALLQHQDSVLLLMQQCIQQTGQVSDAFKQQIVSLKAYELIPTLISTFQKQTKIKDAYILTTLCRLMENNYAPFQATTIYQELYVGDSLTQNMSRFEHPFAVPFTKANTDAILSLAADFFKSMKASLGQFVPIQGGTFLLGKVDHSLNPAKTVTVLPFSIGRYEVTNREFSQFTAVTGYQTLAERHQNALVFRLGLEEFEWFQDPTANWQFPNGISKGGIEDKMDHPVTCISFLDAQAYCQWAGCRLPTLDEWELASRGGVFGRGQHFENGPQNIHAHANIWRGKDHIVQDDKEVHITTSPVGAYWANPFGLFDMYGNVFEFCANTPKHFTEGVVAMRGGSWWCSPHACGFFNSVDIGKVRQEASFSNHGFRVVI